MTSNEFRSILENYVKNGRITDNERVDIEFTCAELQLRPNAEYLDKYIDKVLHDLSKPVTQEITEE